MTQILCRFDAAANVPVVFITDYMADGHITCWKSGAGASFVPVPMDYYHSTLPLSAADEEALKKRFMKATGDKSVFIRHRLPRTVKEVPNRIVKAPVLASVPSPAPTPVPAPIPASAVTASPAPAKAKNKVAVSVRPKSKLAPAGQPIDVAAAVAGLKARFDLELDHLLKTAGITQAQ